MARRVKSLKVGRKLRSEQLNLRVEPKSSVEIANEVWDHMRLFVWAKDVSQVIVAWKQHMKSKSIVDQHEGGPEVRKHSVLDVDITVRVIDGSSEVLQGSELFIEKRSEQRFPSKMGTSPQVKLNTHHHDVENDGVKLVTEEKVHKSQCL
jgi:hypothetical protein